MNTPIKHELPNGVIEWRLPNDVLHREDGPALIFPNGEEHWYKNGKWHRDDGPASIYPDGEEYWYQNDKHHRTDGPAVICSDGTAEYWIEGTKYDPVTFLFKSYEYIRKN